MTNTTLVTNKTPETVAKVQESMEGVEEGSNKQKKILESKNGSSPERERKEACEKVKRLIKDMRESGEVNEREENEGKAKDTVRRKPCGSEEGEIGN